MDTLNTAKSSKSGSSDAFSLKRILLMMVHNWHLFVISFLIAGGGAYAYIKYKIPSYRATTTVLVEEEGNSPGQDMLLEGFSVRPGSQNLDNQILIISSYSMIRRAVDELPFEIDVYRKGLLRKASYYPLSPLRIEPGEEGLPYRQEFRFEYKGNEKFQLSTTSDADFDLDTLVNFGQELKLAGGSFTIYPQPEYADIYRTGDKIYIQFNDKERLTNIYISQLRVENATRDGSIIRLSLEGTNRIKDIIFLDKLTEVYIQSNLEKKNQEAKRIIEFIDEQLVDVSDSLMLTETQLQEFRSRNRIMNVSAQAEQIINQAVVLENEKAELNLKKNYYEYLEDYLAEGDNDDAPIAPASMGIEDPLLANLMQELAGLQAQYFTSGVGERNPLQGQLVNRIDNVKQSIRETLTGIKLANQMAIRENADQIDNLNSQASGLPIKERQLLGFERKFNLNNVLYTFLLQRRAEAQIQRASNAPDHQLIDPARSTEQISPNPMNTFAFALSLAIVFPILLLLLGAMLQNKITCEEDVTMITSLPVVAQFPHSRLNYYTVVLNEPSSVISEAFRSLRSRMEFFTKEVECPLVVVSSSMPGEGKTFAAINLASAYSLADKKTLLIGFDLRRPTISKGFDLNDNNGITNYLIGKSKLDDIIVETDYENLHILPSGPIPPNPGELADSEKTKELITSLRQQYDCIVVDSAPIGIVSDIYSVASMSDALLLLIRHGHSKKDVLSATLAEIQGNGIHNLGLIINDVKSKGRGYRYDYKYKYDYKSKEKKRGLKSILEAKVSKN